MTLRVSLVIDGSAASAKQALAETGAGLKTIAADATRSSAVLNNAFAAQGRATKSAADAIKGLSFEARNLSFQLIDVAQGVAMGQSAFMIFAQQAGQIGQIIAFSPNGLGGMLREIKTAIGALLTPLRLTTLGAVALGAAGYAVYSSWKSAALPFEDVARVANVTLGRMRELESAAAFKGIDTSQFLGFMEKLSELTHQATYNAGGLADVFRAAGVPAGDVTKNLERAADLIKNAGSDQQRLVLLQQMGLPATMQWVRFLSQGSDGIRHAVREAGVFGSEAEQKLVGSARRFSEAWNRSWTQWGNAAKGSVMEALDWVDRLVERGMKAAIGGSPARQANLLKWGFQGVGDVSRLNQDDANRFYSAVGVGPRNVTVDRDALLRQANLERQRIGILGETASIEQIVLGVEKEILVARLNGVRISGTEEAALKRLAAERSLGITQIRSQADAQRVEAEAIGMGVGQAAAYTAAQNALNEARRQGRALTADQIASIEQEAAALGQAAQRADNLRTGYDAFRGAIQGFSAELAQSGNAWAAFKKAGLDALSSLNRVLSDMAARNLWQAAFGGKGGGGGLGLDAGITSVFAFHGGRDPFDPRPSDVRSVHSVYFENAPRFHSGRTPFAPNEIPAVITKDEYVFKPQQLRQALGMAQAAAPAGNLNLNVTVAATVAGTGDQELIANMKSAAEMGAREAISQFSRRELPDRVLQIIDDPTVR